MYSKEDAKEKIKKLAEDFGDRIDYIKNSGQYKEAQIEDEFIKPLFKYLNWNISNEGIKNPSDREFIVQPKGRDGKEPDYLLHLDGKPRFYMEAKHSKYWLFKETKYIWQAYQYAYSTQSLSPPRKIDFALLTDFEEFRFFDCTFPVKNKETLNNFVSLDWMYTDYIKKFDLLWEHFERENVRNGSLEKLYLSEKKVKENRIPPDKAFLIDLDDEKDGWRIKLAKEIKKLQPEFSAEFITQSVQLILDRFIFMKVLIDREIEEDLIQKIVQKIQKEKSVGAEDSSALSVFDECKDTFEFLDKTYNGSIFSHRQELDSVKVGNKILLEVLKDFIPENSRYNFKIIPVEILGTIYEQFLGKVVVTTDKRASIEYKPEVRKAGGVYYTPDYIVNYIVEKTVGEKLKECKKFEDLLSLKICDPACGSGSFLIAAYDALIHWTMNYYKEKKLTKEEQKLVYQMPDGDIRLSSKIKRDILQACIYGVDIDAQAVEVTRMSLSLKALEDTNHNQVYDERTLWHTTILPPLEGNIKCGNSLIGTDIYKQQDLFTLGDKEKLKINAFDWDTEFPSIFKNGGFDVVIGNPPYVRIQTMQETNPQLVSALKTRFVSAGQGNYDLYVVFIEQGLKLLNSKGKLSFILPHKFLNAQYGKPIRNHLKAGKHLSKLIHFGDNQVFEGATTYTCLLFLNRSPQETFEIVRVKSLEQWQVAAEAESAIISADQLGESEWNFNIGASASVFEKLAMMPVKLGDIAERIAQGIRTSANEVYVLDLLETNNKQVTAHSEQLGKKVELERASVSQFLKGREIKPYQLLHSGKILIIPYHISDSRPNFILEKEYQSKFPKTFSYLLANKSYLEKRERGRMKGDHWYAYIYPKNIDLMLQPKILIPDIADRASFAFDEHGEYAFTSGYGITLKSDISFTIKYLLGLLNSSVLDFYLKKVSTTIRGGYFRYFTQYLEQLPIKVIDIQKKEEKSPHDLMVQLVDTMLDLKKKLPTTKTEHEKISLQRQIDSTDREIDSLVYKLYNLTPEEIAIVEGKTP